MFLVSWFRTLFVEHLDKVNMSYPTHFCLSCKYAIRLTIGSVKAVIHAFVPGLYVDDTTKLALSLHKELSEKNE